MKIIFLDMDGVLNDHKRQPNGYRGVKPECVREFNRILTRTDARIVISSSWRYIMPGDMSTRGFSYLLCTHGVKCYDKVSGSGKLCGDSKVIGYTARDEVISTRGEQIQQWMRDHPCIKIDSFVVLDDMDCKRRSTMQITTAGLGPNFVQTNGKVGLTKADADNAIRILNQPVGTGVTRT